MTDRPIDPHDHPDVKHLMDLLELLDWDRQSDGGWAPRHWREFQVGLDHETWNLFNNSTLDYVPLREGRGDWSTVSRLCLYMLGAFDGDRPDTWKAIGERLGRTLFIDTGEVIGRRWCEEVAATAWRLKVANSAAEMRLGRVASISCCGSGGC